MPAISWSAAPGSDSEAGETPAASEEAPLVASGSSVAPQGLKLKLLLCLAATCSLAFLGGFAARNASVYNSASDGGSMEKLASLEGEEGEDTETCSLTRCSPCGDACGEGACCDFCSCSGLKCIC